MHYINARLNILDNAPLAIYQVALARNWLITGLKTNSSHVDARLSKMEAAGNLTVKQFMEREAAVAITTKAMHTEEPKWTTVMAKNMHQVVSQVVETLANAPKQEECKFNLRPTGFEAKEGETEKYLVQRLNTELLQGQMKLPAKVIAATWQQLVTIRSSTSTARARLGAVLLKFATSEDHQVAFRGRKGLVGTKLGLDEDLILAQQACKSELWSLFKEAKVVGKRAFWWVSELFINSTWICLPSSI